ncbi:MAG: hypothetical protein JWQ89_3176 [Devosia sp.]|uniref:hypothetical protein n=1 Tax=Devosia sp. TaxID=1871048 RepID=UPI002634906B|nr:hypothetical protein [Devosia sp.]MDB5541449.1 hypothetical protein [Devosia sp.]
MRSISTLAGMVLLTVAATAAELPLQQAYGTPNGCAVHAGGASQSGGGDNTVFTTKDIRFSGAVCLISSATADTSVTDGAAWEVKVRCDSGHDDPVPGTLLIKEQQSAINVTLVDGEGPEGDFPACAAPTK